MREEGRGEREGRDGGKGSVYIFFIHLRLQTPIERGSGLDEMEAMEIQRRYRL